MKKSQLALAVLTAAALLAACDDQKKPAEKGSTTEQTQTGGEKAAAAPAAQQAAAVEARYKADVALAGAVYEKMYASGPNANLFRKYAYSVSDYQGGEAGATAKTSLTLDLNPQVYGDSIRPVTLHFTDTITYNQALLDKGIVAHVEHKLDNPEDVKVFVDNFSAMTDKAADGEDTAEETPPAAEQPAEAATTGAADAEKPAEAATTAAADAGKPAEADAEKPAEAATTAAGAADAEKPAEAAADDTKAADKNAAVADGLGTVLDHLHMHTDLLTDDNAVATATISPFQHQNGDDSIDFKGLAYNIRYNSKTLTDGVLDIDFALEPLTITDADKADGNTSTVSIAAVKGGWGIKEDGTFHLKIDPIKTETTGADGMSTFELAGIEGKGEGLKFDSAIGGYLGSVNVNATGIRVTHNTDTINLGDFNLKTDSKKTAAGNYDMTGTFLFKLDGASLKQAIPALPVEPQSLRIHIGLSELSAAANTALGEGLQLLNPHLAAGKTDLPPETREKIKTAIGEIVQNKTRFDTGLEAQTDSGKALLTASVGIRSDSPVTVEEWQQAIDNAQENPLPLQTLLKNNLDLNAEFRVSKTLVDKLGFSEMVEQQGAMFVTLEGDEYRAKIESKEGQILLNGNPLPH